MSLGSRGRFKKTGEENITTAHEETFGGDGYIHSLDYDDSFFDVYMLLLRV